MSGPYTAICKKDVKFTLIPCTFTLIKNVEYSYRIANDNRFIVDDGNDNRVSFSENDIKKYFYSIKEIRTEKLKKLNENKSIL